MSYSLEDKARARQLFVEEGLTYEEVAEETGVSTSQLKNWGREGEWQKAREEFERDYLELTTNVHKLKLETVKKALTSKHSQDIIAATNLLRAMPIGRKSRHEIDRAAIFLDFMASFVSYLRQRDGDALRYLQPHVSGFADYIKSQGIESAA